MSDELLLSVIIPAYNEAKRLPRTLQQIVEYCTAMTLSFEILVVDDGSMDDTSMLVKKLEAETTSIKLLSYFPNRGKGYAIRVGVLQARGRYVLFSDADLSTPISELDRFLPLLESGRPIVIGTRKHGEARILKHQPFWREAMGKVYTGISNLILGLHASDFTCGFKAFQNGAARDIFQQQRIERWAFDSEVLFLSKLCGYDVEEVPVRWINSPDSKVRILRDTITSFLALLKIRQNALTGKYSKPASLPVAQQVNGKKIEAQR